MNYILPTLKLFFTFFSFQIEEFLEKARELEEFSKEPILALKVGNADDVLCEHKGSGKPFAYGLCRICYDDVSPIHVFVSIGCTMYVKALMGWCSLCKFQVDLREGLILQLSSVPK